MTLEEPRSIKAKVIENLRLDTSHRPGLTAEDFATNKKTVGRKAAGFWVEGSPRTTVRKFAHDCVVSASQPQG